MFCCFWLDLFLNLLVPWMRISWCEDLFLHQQEVTNHSQGF